MNGTELISAVPQATPPTFAPFQVKPAVGTPRYTPMETPPAAQQTPAVNEAVIQSLAGYLKAKWQEARQHLEQSGVGDQIMRAKRARDLKYEPKKLAQILAIEGPDYDPPYDPIIDVKCRALEAKLTKDILTPGDRPWSLEPTPIPDLPEDVRQTIDMMVEQRVAQMVADEAIQQGRTPTIEEVQQRTTEILPGMRTLFLAEMKRKAREAVEKMSQKIDDQLTEGKWREAVKKLLHDFVTYPACFLKGPTLKRDRRISQEFDPQTRKWRSVIEERKIDTWTRVAPDKIYPEPHSSGINDGYLFELASRKRKDLWEAKSIEGYDAGAISRVLAAHASGGLHEWTLLDTEKKLIEKKSTFTFGSDLDCLIFWGTAPGKLLLSWGMPEKVITDPDREYDIWAEMIGNEVIMARLNPDPLGEKPYFKACLIEDPDRFWNKAMPDLLWDISVMCCGVLRAAGINAAFAAGPMVDIAVDRLQDQRDTTVYPRRSFKSTSKQMLESKVVNFYQPQILTGALGQFLDVCHTLADEWSGIMRMSHGGEQSLPNTASTTSMFITQSNQGVAAYEKNLDFGILAPSVAKQYQTNLWENKDEEYSSPYLDAKIVARGAASMTAKEQQSIRQMEFTTTLLPEEKQILGMDGLKELLRHKIQALEMDIDKLLPEDRDVIERMTGMQIPAQGGQSELPGPGAAPEALNPAGDKSGGRDFALVQGAQA